MESSKMNSMEIGNQLKELRRQSGKTSIEMSNALGISQSAITMYETGRRIPRDEIKIRIADYFGVTVESIFFSKNSTKRAV